MAELDKLIIEISADDAQLIRAINQSSKALKDFGITGTATASELTKALSSIRRESQKATDPEQIRVLAAAYVRLTEKLNTVKTSISAYSEVVDDSGKKSVAFGVKGKKVAAELNQIDEAARRARIALYGANQVVRDLPFGFIAISNNIPVALDQFQELVKQTGGVDKAFKSLGGAMLGAGGLSIAFSALTSLAVSLIQEYGSLANATNTIFDLIDKDTIALIKQKDAYAGVSAEIKGETSKISLLTSTLGDAQQSYNARINSYNELKKIAPGVIQDITLENALTEDGSRIIKNRSLDLIDYIQLKGRESALIKLIADEEEKGLKATQNLIRQVTGEGRTWVDVLSDATQAAIFQNPIAALKSTSKEVINASKQTQFWSKSLDTVRRQILEFDGLVTGQVSFSNLTKEQEKYNKEQEQNAKAQENTIKKSISDQLNAKINALKAEIDAKKAQIKNLNQLSSEYVDAQILIAQKEYQISVLNSTKQIKNKQELNSALISLEQELEAKKANIINTAAAARLAAVDEELQKRKKGIQDELDYIDQTTNEILGKPDINNKRISDSFAILGEELKKQDEIQKQLLKDYLAFADGIATSISNIAGDLVQGVLDGKSAIDVLRDSIKQLIVQLAIAVAKAAALKAIQNIIGVAGAAGGAAFNPLSLLKFGLLGAGARGGGGIFGGLRTEGIVEGPGGLALSGNVTFIQRGTDLVGVLNRTNNRIGRVG